MGTRIAQLARRVARPKRLDVALALVALGCAFVIEALHGHACTGDGCVLCLAALLAHVLLFVSVGTVLACPVIRVLAELRALRMDVLRRRESRPLSVIPSRAERVELTPVTMGVQLII